METIVIMDNSLSKARLEDVDSERNDDVEGKIEGGSDFTGVTVESWTSFNRWQDSQDVEAEMNLDQVAHSEQPGLLGLGSTDRPPVLSRTRAHCRGLRLWVGCLCLSF